MSNANSKPKYSPKARDQRRFGGIFKGLLTFTRNVTIGLTVILCVIWIVLAQPTFRANSTIDLEVDTDRLQTVVKKLSVDFHPRRFSNLGNLDATADFIESHFKQAGGQVEIQEFTVNQSAYRNVRCFFGPTESERTIIGAHYDSHNQTPGADDNASGVAGLIELAYIFGNQPPTTRIELVAYTLEEPPFFGSKQMGSYIHAESIADEKESIRGMIALEMIGYFSDEFGSQEYPAHLFNLIYPSTGDFIAVVGDFKRRDYIAQIKVGMKGSTDLRVYSIAAPAQIPGIDFSDHRNYWEFDMDAVMVTDTAFYRNHNYHTADDTWDRLDYERMADVVRAVYSAVVFE
ncbi:MAG: M28 family peptidase [Verrucomicrobia bacterium]|jgi:hypothetical protein|nr:M28 family peptidase [Verrucomicrobiota bacterium]